LPQRAGGLTAGHRLVGCPTDGEPAVPLCAPPGLHLLGTDARSLKTAPDADRALGMGLTAAMVHHFVRNEYALTVEDVLARRWRALFLDAHEAGVMATEVAELMRQDGVADPRLADFMALCQTYAGNT